MENIAVEECVDSGGNIVVQLLKAITRKLPKLLRDNYQPKGMNIIFRTPYYSPKYYSPNGLNPGNGYSANFSLMYLYCTHENKKEKIDDKGGLPAPCIHSLNTINKLKNIYNQV